MAGSLSPAGPAAVVRVAADVHFALVLRGRRGDLAVVVPAERRLAGGEGAGDEFVLDHDDHPDADLVVAPEQWRARNVSRACALVGWAPSSAARSRVTVRRVVVLLTVRLPSHLGGDGGAGFKGVEKAFADMRRTADARKEGRLEETWDAEGGGDEDDA